MKTSRILLAAVLALSVAACSSTKTQGSFQSDASKPANIADFYLEPPVHTETSVYFAGMGLSRDLSMANEKAKLDAERKLSNFLAGRIKTMTRQYKVDGGNADQNLYAEKTEIVVQKVSKASIAGAHRTKIQVFQEGNLFRVYVLMEFPLGEANKIAQANLGASIMPGLDAPAAAMREDMHKELRGDNDRPQASAAPAQKVNLVDGNGETKTVEMLPISDPKVKARRDEALSKPGAVYGQMTVPM